LNFLPVFWRNQRIDSEQFRCGVIMGMCVEESVNEWFDSLPRTGGIYRLIDEARDDRRQKDRIGAVIALGESGDPRAVRPLVDCCRDRDPEIRRHAIEALHKLRSGRAVHVLTERLKDQDELPATRERAIAALAAIRSYGAIQELKDRFSDADEDPAIRSSIGQVLSLMRIR
jgi:HEAT repeat protein